MPNWVGYRACPFESSGASGSDNDTNWSGLSATAALLQDTMGFGGPKVGRRRVKGPCASGGS
jgi:hypothetical protein